MNVFLKDYMDLILGVIWEGENWFVPYPIEDAGWEKSKGTEWQQVLGNNEFVPSALIPGPRARTVKPLWV